MEEKRIEDLAARERKIVEVREARNLSIRCHAKNGVCVITKGDVEKDEVILGSRITIKCPQAKIAISKNGIESIFYGVEYKEEEIVRDERIEKCSYDRVLSDF